MLHAVAQRKARSFLIRSAGTRGTIPLEDIITSSVFGPLAVLEPHRVWTALHIAFEMHPPDWKPARSDVVFWPRSSDGVEPDMMVNFGDLQENRLRFLIEIKWNSGFGHEQASRQWDAFGGPHVRHIFIARDALSIRKHWTDDPVTPEWRASRVAVTWSDMKDRLRREAVRQDQQLARWAMLVDNFLEALGEGTFTGFDFPTGGLAAAEEVSFWSTRFEWPTTLAPCASSAFFSDLPTDGARQ